MKKNHCNRKLPNIRRFQQFQLPFSLSCSFAKDNFHLCCIQNNWVAVLLIPFIWISKRRQIFLELQQISLFYVERIVWWFIVRAFSIFPSKLNEMFDNSTIFFLHLPDNQRIFYFIFQCSSSTFEREKKWRRIIIYYDIILNETARGQQLNVVFGFVCFIKILPWNGWFELVVVVCIAHYVNIKRI